MEDKIKELSKKFNVSVELINQIYNSLKEPQDVRDSFKDIELKTELINFKDIKIGDEFKGIVRNVVDFGAFVDIGIHNDGLVHKSQISNKFIKNIHKHISVGDEVVVKVIDKDEEKERVSLSMKGLNK